MKGRDGNEASDHWKTPLWLYNKLDDEFKFDFDPCPLHADFDGLIIDWGKSNYINPPYNRLDKPAFIMKSYTEFKKGKSCVMLIPSSTSTVLFHEIIIPFAHVRFLKGRVAFQGYNSKGEFTKTGKGKHDSMIVIFNKDYKPNLI
jgi:site-specific DNA-methyltransferase (adenine-specific)